MRPEIAARFVISAHFHLGTSVCCCAISGNTHWGISRKKKAHCCALNPRMRDISTGDLVNWPRRISRPGAAKHDFASFGPTLKSQQFPAQGTCSDRFPAHHATHCCHGYSLVCPRSHQRNPRRRLFLPIFLQCLAKFQRRTNEHWFANCVNIKRYKVIQLA
jgi:hypothetical protein